MFYVGIPWVVLKHQNILELAKLDKHLQISTNYSTFPTTMSSDSNEYGSIREILGSSEVVASRGRE